MRKEKKTLVDVAAPRPSIIPRRTSILGARDVLMRALADLILSHSSPKALLRRVLDVAAELLDADRGTIYLYDEERDELVSVAAHLTEIPTIRVPLSQGVAGYVARVGEMVNIPTCDSDSRFWKRVDERTGYQTRCMLTAPVRDGAGRCLGVVQLLNKREGTFSAADEETLLVLVGEIGTLLEQISVVEVLENLQRGGDAANLPPSDGAIGASGHTVAPPVVEKRQDVFTLEPTLPELEARYITYLLQQHDGNRSLCARLLGVGRNTLHRKMRLYGIS